MIKLAICDDEENARAWLRALVERQNVECEIAEYSDGASYLAQGTEYDLLILDIGLPSPGSCGKGDAACGKGGGECGPPGAEGLELARLIRGMELGRQPVIIFVTGYEQYVYDAFDVDAFHYLVKPVDERKFAEVFNRAAERILETRRQKNLVIPCEGTNRIIPVGNIYYMESRNHKIVLHLRDGNLEYYGRLAALEKELQGLFFRIHKGYLVNLAYVEEYGRTEVALANGCKLPVSRYKFEDFVKAYLRWMK